VGSEGVSRGKVTPGSDGCLPGGAGRPRSA